MIKLEPKQYPEKLYNIQNPPKQLFCEGNIKLLEENSIAVIGSRVCTDYGREYTKKFVNELVKNDICIVSGMAKGIDSIAHQAAIEQGGKTIAVLGSGLLNIYPEENISLYNEILINKGLVITEYEPKVKPEGKNFPERNRIVSALSQAVLVIEAIHRSGTTITAQLAQKQGKKVYCIPRNLGEKNGVGTNWLIQKGAILVTNPNEIIEEMRETPENQQIYIDEINEVPEDIKIPEEYKEVYQYLTTLPQTTDEIARKSGIKISDINSKLILMEMEGIIKKYPGGQFCREN